MKNKLLLIFGGIILILCITNPSMRAMREYLGVNSEAKISRQYNFLLFSIYLYTVNIDDEFNPQHYRVKYVGIFANFIRLN